MVKMPSSAEISKRYKDAIPRVASAYKQGVEKVTDFPERAIAGQDLYVERMRDPDVLERRAAKLAKISNEDWRGPASDVGAARIGPGMAANVTKQARNYEPIRTALEGVSLPDRTGDAMANIDNRVKPVVKAQIDAKKAAL